VTFTQPGSIAGTSHRCVGLTPVRRPCDIRQRLLTRLGPRFRILLDILHDFHVERHAKVGKLNIAVLRGEDVRRLEIAVDDLIKSVNQTGPQGVKGETAYPLRVEIVQPLEDLGHVGRHEFLVELAERLERLSETPIFHKPAASSTKPHQCCVCMSKEVVSLTPVRYSDSHHPSTCPHT
jgi:hypothetical protein